MKLIVVDGMDGCGKDTHAERIREALRADGTRTVLISHPSGRMLGRLSRMALQSSGPLARALATVFYTADVLVSAAWFRRQKDEGVAIFVRYLLGSAYLPPRLASAGYAFFRRLLPLPDLAVFIDIDPDVALRRISRRGRRPEMFETHEKLVAVRAVAHDLTRNGWVTIDNSEDGAGPFEAMERILAERGLVRGIGKA